jgi:hypothetical protein
MHALNLITYEKRKDIHTPVYDKDAPTKIIDEDENEIDSNIIELRQKEGINPDEWIVYEIENEKRELIYKGNVVLTLPNCDPKYWKNDNGNLVEMSTSEKDAINAIDEKAARTREIETLVFSGADKRVYNIKKCASTIIQALIETGFTSDIEVAKDEVKKFLETYQTEVELYKGGGKRIILINAIDADSIYTWLPAPYESLTILEICKNILNDVYQ